jgi:hypothetical protein
MRHPKVGTPQGSESPGQALGRDELKMRNLRYISLIIGVATLVATALLQFVLKRFGVSLVNRVIILVLFALVVLLIGILVRQRNN